MANYNLAKIINCGWMKGESASRGFLLLLLLKLLDELGQNLSSVKFDEVARLAK